MAHVHYPFAGIDEDTKRSVFAKGQVIEKYDPKVWRRDQAGNLMHYRLHGQEEKYGWEIAMIVPAERGGRPTVDNLVPIWWRARRQAEAAAAAAEGEPGPAGGQTTSLLA